MALAILAVGCGEKDPSKERRRSKKNVRDVG
jgi:hypothetical protein